MLPNWLYETMSTYTIERFNKLSELIKAKYDINDNLLHIITFCVYYYNMISKYPLEYCEITTNDINNKLNNPETAIIKKDINTVVKELKNIIYPNSVVVKQKNGQYYILKKPHTGKDKFIIDTYPRTTSPNNGFIDPINSYTSIILYVNENIDVLKKDCIDDYDKNIFNGYFAIIKEHYKYLLHELHIPIIQRENSQVNKNKDNKKTSKFDIISNIIRNEKYSELFTESDNEIYRFVNETKKSYDGLKKFFDNNLEYFSIDINNNTDYKMKMEVLQYYCEIDGHDIFADLIKKLNIDCADLLVDLYCSLINHENFSIKFKTSIFEKLIQIPMVFDIVTQRRIELDLNVNYSPKDFKEFAHRHCIPERHTSRCKYIHGKPQFVFTLVKCDNDTHFIGKINEDQYAAQALTFDEINKLFKNEKFKSLILEQVCNLLGSAGY